MPLSVRPEMTAAALMAANRVSASPNTSPSVTASAGGDGAETYESITSTAQSERERIGQVATSKALGSTRIPTIGPLDLLLLPCVASDETASFTGASLASRVSPITGCGRMPFPLRTPVDPIPQLPTMPQLTDLVDQILGDTRFDARRYGTYTAAQMRSLYRRDMTGQHVARTARAVVPEASLAVLVERLDRELQAYIEPESQRIGTGLVALMGGALDSAEPTVTEFARTLVMAAAILGSGRAVEILRGWLAGEPYRYRIKVLLAGVRCEKPLALEEGVRVTQLPEGGYAADLAPHLPSSLIRYETDAFRFLGQTVLSIDGTAAPALYRPRGHGDEPDRNLRQVWAGGKIPCLTTSDWRQPLTEALSLASDHCVRWTHGWLDPGDLAAFNFGFSGHTSTDESSRGDAVLLQQEHLEAARDLDVQRHARAQSPKAVDMAIKRWISSKRPNATLADRYIDLRIALEVLYLPRSRGELRFRLALMGAWHLGADFEERRRYYDLLKEAYDFGSAAVHTGDVKDTPASRDTLAAAQRACRRGILKRLAETEERAWDAVEAALGSPNA